MYVCNSSNPVYEGKMQTSYKPCLLRPHTWRSIPQIIPLDNPKPDSTSFSVIKFYKMVKIPTLKAKFTHFYLKLLKYFYIFRILRCPGSSWCNWLQDSSSIKGEKYCPGKWSYKLNVYRIMFLVIH